MNKYRSYMDRIHVSSSLHQRLLELEQTGGTERSCPPRRSWVPRLGGAIACCALVVLAGWGLLRGPLRTLWDAGEPSVGVALPPASAPVWTTPPTPEPAPTADVEPQYSLVVEDPFDGQPHGDFNLPVVSFTELPAGGEIFVDSAPAFEQTIANLSAEDMIHMLGGTDEVPWPLYWSGFCLTGIGYFDKQEQLTKAVIQGERGETTIALTLSPGEIPFTDVIYGDVEEQEYDGTGQMVKAFYIDMENGLYYHSAEFMSGDTGARFDVTGPDQEEAAFLVAYVLRTGVRWEGEHSFTTEGITLNQDAIQQTGRFLTLEEAYAEELGAYLPKPVRGFTSDSVQTYRWYGPDSSQVMERLWTSWYKGYDYVTVNISRYPSYYKVPAPDFSAGEVTAEALEALGSYVDDDAGDVPSWRYSFSVQQYTPEEEWNIVVDYSIKGLTPQEAASLVNIRSFDADDALPPLSN